MTAEQLGQLLLRSPETGEPLRVRKLTPVDDLLIIACENDSERWDLYIRMVEVADGDKGGG